MTTHAEDLAHASEKYAARVRERDDSQTRLTETQTQLAEERAARAEDAKVATASISRLTTRVTELEALIPHTLTFGVGVDVLGALESKAKKSVGYHRTYWTLPATGVATGAVAQAKADLAAGRTPILSFKLPGKSADWAGASAGKFDAPLKATIAELAKLDGVVIVAVVHEPEGDGSLVDYRAMTAHFIPLVKVGRIQFWQCGTGFHQLYGDGSWSLEKFYVPGVDGIGIDPYQSYLASGGGTEKDWTDQTVKYYQPLAKFCKAKGIQSGVWETALNKQAAASGHPKVATWVPDCVAGAKAAGLTMWCYFNSETKKDGFHDWRLDATGADRLGQMAAAVAAYARA